MKDDQIIGIIEGMDLHQCIVTDIQQRLSLVTSPILFGLLPYYTDEIVWIHFPNNHKLSLEEEYNLKEIFLKLPIYATFVIVDEAEKDEEGKPKLRVWHTVPKSVQDNEKYVQYHDNCVKKLMIDFRDNQLKKFGFKISIP